MKTESEKRHDLSALLRHLQPKLHDKPCVFVHLPGQMPCGDLPWIALFRESEGLTLVLPQAVADERGYTYDYVAAWITLEVHSALEAVGLTAAFSTALAKAGISCNVMAGYYHDHLFVPYTKRGPAMEALTKLSAGVGK